MITISTQMPYMLYGLVLGVLPTVVMAAVIVTLLLRRVDQVKQRAAKAVLRVKHDCTNSTIKAQRAEILQLQGANEKLCIEIEDLRKAASNAVLLLMAEFDKSNPKSVEVAPNVKPTCPSVEDSTVCPVSAVSDESTPTRM